MQCQCHAQLSVEVHEPHTGHTVLLYMSIEKVQEQMRVYESAMKMYGTVGPPTHVWLYETHSLTLEIITVGMRPSLSDL